MSKPTKDQIAAEIAALKALKPVGLFARKTAAAIELIIEELEHGIDQTSDEWHELTDEQQDHVLQAMAWKDGHNTDRPSEGWGGLVA